jgi:hypothetical protein
MTVSMIHGRVGIIPEYRKLFHNFGIMPPFGNISQQNSLLAPSLLSAFPQYPLKISALYSNNLEN